MGRTEVVKSKKFLASFQKSLEKHKINEGKTKEIDFFMFILKITVDVLMHTIFTECL